MNSINRNNPNQSNRREQDRQKLSHANGGTVLSPCAFHPHERITNFCTNRDCLLPLCPKCVKIHADEHIKMGVFGQFETIEESLRGADEGLKFTVQALTQLELSITEVRQSYDTKIAQQRRNLRDAKNYFMEEIERIFDGFEKALLNYENRENKQFIEELYNSDQYLGHLSEHCQKALKRLNTSQTVMEGIINYYSEAESVKKVEIIQENLRKLFPQTIHITYHPPELQRLQSLIKRYIDAGSDHDQIWNHYKNLFSKEEEKKIPERQAPKEYRKQVSPKQTKPQKTYQESPPRQREEVRQEKNPSDRVEKRRIMQLSDMQSNLKLAKFKSPLDNFSLAKLRQDKNDIR